MRTYYFTPNVITATATPLPPVAGVGRSYRYLVAVITAGYRRTAYYVLRAPSVALARAAVASAYTGPTPVGPIAALGGPGTGYGAYVSRIALGATEADTPGYGLLTTVALPGTRYAYLPLPPNALLPG